MFASFLILPQFAQTPERTGYGFGFSVTEAGLLLMPTALAQLAAGPLPTRLAERIGFRTVLALGALLITAAFLINTFAHDHAWELVIGGTLLGRGDHVLLRLDGEPDRRRGAAVGRRHRDGHQHRHGRSAARSARRSPPRSSPASGSRAPLPTEGAYTAAFAFATVAGLLALLASRLVPRSRTRQMSLEPVPGTE